MIIEWLVQWLNNFIIGMLQNLTQWVTIPTDLINVIGTISGYGTFIVGSDILSLILITFGFWTTMRCSVGLGLTIWRLLPFT